MKIGLGYDIHRLVEGRPLILGGISIPSDRGLLGHSDGDALLHAITDAALGAAGLGDIGELFPDDDPAFKDADSARLLEHAMEKVRTLGFEVGNLDVNVVAERPKLKRHKAALRKRIASILGCLESRVNIKAKTREGLDAVGRGEAIEIHCAILLSEDSPHSDTRGECQ